jgi:hypothetical protein
VLKSKSKRVDSGGGADSGIRQDQPLLPPGTAPRLPRQGHDRRMAKGRGVRGRQELRPTDEGTPQGGIVSPVLLNVALHGLEEAAGVRLHAGNTRADSPVLIR